MVKRAKRKVSLLGKAKVVQPQVTKLADRANHNEARPSALAARRLNEHCNTFSKAATVSHESGAPTVKSGSDVRLAPTGKFRRRATFSGAVVSSDIRMPKTPLPIRRSPTLRSSSRQINTNTPYSHVLPGIGTSPFRTPGPSQDDPSFPGKSFLHKITRVPGGKVNTTPGSSNGRRQSSIADYFSRTPILYKNVKNSIFSNSPVASTAVRNKDDHNGGPMSIKKKRTSWYKKRKATSVESGDDTGKKFDESFSRNDILPIKAPTTPKLPSTIGKVISNTPKKLLNAVPSIFNYTPKSVGLKPVSSLNFPFSLRANRRNSCSKSSPQNQLPVDNSPSKVSGFDENAELKNDDFCNNDETFVVNELQKENKNPNPVATMQSDNCVSNKQDTEINLNIESLLSMPENPLENNKISMLAIQLPIGYKLNRLLQFYRCLSTVSNRNLSKGIPLLFFSNLKAPVEQLMDNKRFTLETLQQLLWICPSLLDVKYVALKDNNVERNFDYEIILVNKDRIVVDKPLNWDEEVDREQIFHSSLVRWVDFFHEEFSRTANRSLHTDLTNWHPMFNVDEISSIPLKKLPVKLNIPQSPKLLKNIIAGRCDILSSYKRSTKLSPISTRNSSPISPCTSLGNSNGSVDLNCHLEYDVGSRTPIISSKWGSLSPPILSHSCRSPGGSKTPLRCFKDKNFSPMSVSLRDMSPLSLTRCIPSLLSPITPICTPNKSDFVNHSPISHIEMKEQRKRSLLLLERELRKEEDEAYSKMRYWDDLHWVFDKLVHTFSQFACSMIQQTPLLAKRISRNFQDRFIAPSRIEKVFIELAALIPQAILLSNSVCNKGVKCLKFNPNCNVPEILQEIKDRYKEAEKHYKVILSETERKIEEYFKANEQEHSDDINTYENITKSINNCDMSIKDNHIAHRDTSSPNLFVKEDTVCDALDKSNNLAVKVSSNEANYKSTSIDLHSCGDYNEGNVEK